MMGSTRTAAFCRAAAGFVYNECSGWGGPGGRGGTGSNGVGDPFVCERVGRWSPWSQQAETMREVMLVDDVLLQSDADEDARSTDEEDRLLTKRGIERQWKTLRWKKTLV